MTTSSPKDVTGLLLEWSRGDKTALDKLIPLVYDELRRLADNCLRRERSGHTLQPTALVHEAYLRLVNETKVTWQNRAHFFGVAARLMRQILIDYARRQHAAKRKRTGPKVSMIESADIPQERDVDLVALDDALISLAAIDPRQSQIVELRFFGGLTIEETAEVLGVSLATVKREWNVAKLWLLREMKKSGT
jgi:RNA polymerase sigma factor (TIGR02999 family)